MVNASKLSLAERLVDVMDALKDAAEVFAQINVLAYELEHEGTNGQIRSEEFTKTIDLIARASVGGHGNAIGMLEEGRPV